MAQTYRSAPIPHLAIRKRWILLSLALIAATGLAIVYPKWREASNNGGQKPVEPFRIAGNLYYVGANDVTAFLVTGPAGHVLIDGGYPGTAPLILASVAKLGFDIRDVKVLLNSHAHFDHAGGLAALQQASGAQLWVSEGDADVIASGGAGDRSMGPLRFLSYLPIVHYPAPRVDHRFADGTTVRVGPVEVTAHVTPGHTPGCTSWAIPVRDGDRDLLAVSICSLGIGPGLSFFPKRYPDVAAQFRQSYATLRALPADIFLGAHGNVFGLSRKRREQATAADPVAPFIDRDGYRKYIDDAEKSLERTLRDSVSS